MATKTNHRRNHHRNTKKLIKALSGLPVAPEVVQTVQGVRR